MLKTKTACSDISEEFESASSVNKASVLPEKCDRKEPTFVEKGQVIKKSKPFFLQTALS